MQIQQEEEERERDGDLFDLLPEAILLEIFNKLHDAKSLCFCLSTCKRFASLIPQTRILHLHLPPLPHHPNSIISNNLFKIFVNRVRLVLNPIRFLLLRFLPIPNQLKYSSSHRHNDFSSFHLPTQMLNTFNQVRSLRVHLPSLSGDIPSSSDGGVDALLKWKAEFGSQLESCVILGAKSLMPHHPNFNFDNKEVELQSSSSSSSYFTSDELKLRVVWTISCLIAASARHHLLKQILSEHEMVEDAVITDGGKQGKISMDKGQIENLRNALFAEMEDKEQGEVERSPLPALKMSMWYVPVLELPESGCVLNGATLVVIRPVATTTEREREKKTSDGELAMGAFDLDHGDQIDDQHKYVGEAVKKMIQRKKAYTLQMTSF